MINNNLESKNAHIARFNKDKSYFISFGNNLYLGKVDIGSIMSNQFGNHQITNNIFDAIALNNLADETVSIILDYFVHLEPEIISVGWLKKTNAQAFQNENASIEFSRGYYIQNSVISGPEITLQFTKNIHQAKVYLPCEQQSFTEKFPDVFQNASFVNISYELPGSSPMALPLQGL
ncbi:hypothetical protein [Leuconostoc citreum]|uniref:hypothetical protein n=1 Tax=Leuconostoc citreum TaxID=33964 RepID=UPI000BFEBF1F|nr:hypothetical protein [Leuconostoc citreum]